MKEVFGVWYDSCSIKQVFIVLAELFAGIIFWMLSIFMLYRNALSEFISLGHITRDIGGVTFVGIYFYLTGLCFFSLVVFQVGSSLNAIRKFKKEFGFLPPVTLEGRGARQRMVDQRLGQEARSFLWNCSEEKRLLAILNNFAAPGVADSVDFIKNVSMFEEELQNTRKRVKESKNYFWRLHHIASCTYLPQPFKVLEKVGDYKDVTFEKPAKHDNEDVARHDNGPSSGISSDKRSGSGGIM